MIDYKFAAKDLSDNLMMTQEEFAKYIGISFALIYKWKTVLNKTTVVVKRKITGGRFQNNIEVLTNGINM